MTIKFPSTFIDAHGFLLLALITRLTLQLRWQVLPLLSWGKLLPFVSLTVYLFSVLHVYFLYTQLATPCSARCLLIYNLFAHKKSTPWCSKGYHFYCLLLAIEYEKSTRGCTILTVLGETNVCTMRVSQFPEHILCLIFPMLPLEIL